MKKRTLNSMLASGPSNRRNPLSQNVAKTQPCLRLTARTTTLDYCISSCSVHAAHLVNSIGARHDVVRADVIRNAALLTN